MANQFAPLLLTYHSGHMRKILNWKGIGSTNVGTLTKVKNFHSYNKLIDINSIFSNNPNWFIADRTLQTKSPFNQRILRPWVLPTEQFDLDRAMLARVRDIEATAKGRIINLFWSGGIDSTTIATAFLKHLTNRDQLRILYSPYSIYEHPGYIKFMSAFQDVELIDISGTIYMTHQFDGIFITGDGGDELNASLDESFFDKYGYDALHLPWKEFFQKYNTDARFIEFCEEYFAIAGRPIDTLLHARWWFYSMCKLTSILYTSKLSLFLDYPNFVFTDLIGFFDCTYYENYMYWDIEKVIPGREYVTWKQNLKDYCFKFDGLGDWCKNKTKYNSNQLTSYIDKKLVLDNQDWIFLLDDGSKVVTPSLPILTRKEFERCYGTTLDYLFNEPDKI